MLNNIEITVKTVKNIRDMAYNGKDEFFSDKTLKQFKLRKQKTKTVYIVELKSNGIFHREVIGDTCTITPIEARNKAIQLINEIKYNQVKPIDQKVIEKYKTKTLQDAFDDYIEARKELKEKTIKEYKRTLETDCYSWLSLPLKLITKDMIMDKFDKKSTTAKYQANRIVRVLKLLYNFAEEKYQEGDFKLILNNPCRFLKIKHLNTEEARDNRIDTKDLPKFWKGTEENRLDTRKMAQTKILCRLCVLTGCREQEICTLKRKNVDLDNQVIYLEHTKNGNKHKIIYSMYVGEMLAKLCNGLEDEDYLFPADTESGHLEYHSKYIKKLRESCGVYFSLHDLRRTFTSYGATFCHIKVEMLEAMTNHKNKTVTFKHYVSAKSDTFPVYRKQFQKIENYIMKHIEK